MLALVGVICIWSPAGALANGCNGSAGDNQYVDPLQNCNPPGSGHSSGGGSSSSGSTTTPSTTPTPTTSTTPTATTAATTTTASSTATAKDPKSSKSLPFTGLNLVPALIVAVSLLGAGLVLRRVAGETE